MPDIGLDIVRRWKQLQTGCRQCTSSSHRCLSISLCQILSESFLDLGSRSAFDVLRGLKCNFGIWQDKKRKRKEKKKKEKQEHNIRESAPDLVIKCPTKLFHLCMQLITRW